MGRRAIAGHRSTRASWTPCGGTTVARACSARENRARPSALVACGRALRAKDLRRWISDAQSAASRGEVFYSLRTQALPSPTGVPGSIFRQSTTCTDTTYILLSSIASRTCSRSGVAPVARIHLSAKAALRRNNRRDCFLPRPRQKKSSRDGLSYLLQAASCTMSTSR